ncbi:hypothetical protein QYF36_008374 [Acer negundo]|nr:hypothetical protein QYF36_008374 [Acer negundo]
MNALCPWKVSLGEINADADTLWFLKIKEFLGFANQIKELELYVSWDEVEREVDIGVDVKIYADVDEIRCNLAVDLQLTGPHVMADGGNSVLTCRNLERKNCG